MTATPHKAIIPNDYTMNLGTIDTRTSFGSMLDITNVYFPTPTRYKAYVGELNINYTTITTITNDDEVSNCKIFCNISLSGESYKEHRFIRFIISPKVTIVNNNTSSNTDVSLSFTIHDGDNRNSLISTCSTYIMTLEPSMHGLLSTVCFVLDTRTDSLSYEK